MTAANPFVPSRLNVVAPVNPIHHRCHPLKELERWPHFFGEMHRKYSLCYFCAVESPVIGHSFRKFSLQASVHRAASEYPLSRSTLASLFDGVACFRRASNQGMAKAQRIPWQPIGAEGAFTAGLPPCSSRHLRARKVEPCSTKALSRALGAFQAHPSRVSGDCFDASPHSRVRTSVQAMLVLERAGCGEPVTLSDDHGSIFT